MRLFEQGAACGSPTTYLRRVWKSCGRLPVEILISNKNIADFLRQQPR